MAKQTIEVKGKVTQDGKTHVLKASVRNGEYLGKMQSSGQNEQDAKNNFESMLKFIGADVTVNYS